MEQRAPDPSTSDVHLRDVTEADLPIFFDHQLDPDATRMANFPARDRQAFMAHWTQGCVKVRNSTRIEWIRTDFGGTVAAWIRRISPICTRYGDFDVALHWTKILGDATIIKQTILCDGQVAGNMVSWEQLGERNVGYWIGKRYWGKGVATRALAAFLRQVRVRPLYALVAKHNLASIRVLEKCGFTLLGEDTESSNAGNKVAEECMLILSVSDGDTAH